LYSKDQQTLIIYFFIGKWRCIRSPRNEAVEAQKTGQLKQWKIDNGYHQRSLAETAMGRYKQLNSPMQSLRDYNGQAAEALAGVKAMNKIIRLGMPVRQQVV